MLNKKLYIIVLLMVSLFSIESCVVNEKIVISNDFTFQIQEAYYQKNIPGVQSQKSYYEVSVTLVNLSDNILLDSVFFNGDKLPLSRWNGNNKTVLTAKAKVKVLAGHNFLNTSIKDSQAVLIGSKLGKKHYFLVDSVTQKADIHLP